LLVKQIPVADVILNHVVWLETTSFSHWPQIPEKIYLVIIVGLLDEQTADSKHALFAIVAANSRRSSCNHSQRGYD
jgi:hypothetical protein